MKPMTKKRLREIRDMAALAHRMADALSVDDPSVEVVVMTAACHSMLAMDVVPELLAEIDRLRAVKAPTVDLVRFDPRGGTA